MRGLTSHVLDSDSGVPAKNVRIELWSLDDKDGVIDKVIEVQTNEEGRCLLADVLEEQKYELRFFIGEYFSAKHGENAKGFLDVVPVRFRALDKNRHYHIPLVVSQWSYTTYKGGFAHPKKS